VVVVVVGGAAGGGGPVGAGPGLGPRVVVGDPGSVGVVVVGGTVGVVVGGVVVTALSGPAAGKHQNHWHFGGSIATWTVCVALPSVPTTVTASDSDRRR
jgi:hypothetical protein